MSVPQDAIAWHSCIAHDFDAKYARSPAFRERVAVWSDLIARHSSAHANVLDAGCGSGTLGMIAASRCQNVVGFDASAKMIALAEAKRRRGGHDNMSLRMASLDAIDFLDGARFDLILCSSVLEYVGDYWQCFDNLARHLAPEGIFLFSLPNGASLYRKAERVMFQVTGRPAYYAHVRHVPSPAVVEAGLRDRGFEVIDRRFYARTPVLSGIARPLGLARLADHLFVLACRRAAPPRHKATYGTDEPGDHSGDEWESP